MWSILCDAILGISSLYEFPGFISPFGVSGPFKEGLELSIREGLNLLEPCSELATFCGTPLKRDQNHDPCHGRS